MPELSFFVMKLCLSSSLKIFFLNLWVKKIFLWKGQKFSYFFNILFWLIFPYILPEIPFIAYRSIQKEKLYLFYRGIWGSVLENNEKKSFLFWIGKIRKIRKSGEIPELFFKIWKISGIFKTLWLRKTWNNFS